MAVRKLKWEEYTNDVDRSCSTWATTDRGWLRDTSGTALANYLDYGALLYRSPHQYCELGNCQCRDSQPGNVYAVAYIGEEYASRYCLTVEGAKQWAEGQVRKALGHNPEGRISVS